MKFCPECGKVWNGSNFCAECGKDLRSYIDGETVDKEVSAVEEKTEFFTDFNFLADMGTKLSEEQNKQNDIDMLAAFEVEELSNGKYMITALKNTSDLFVNIPDCVQIIGEEAFYNCDIIEAKFPEGLVKIGARAFANCVDLEKVNFPKSLRIIEDNAFCGCKLLDVEPPKNVRVAKNAFEDTGWVHPQQVIEWRTHGIELYDQEHYEEAMPVLKKAAEAGDAEAQIYLGSGYEDGDGVDQDDSQAIYWYKKAAEQGNGDAQMRLGDIYFRNDDDSKGLYWYEKASSNEDIDIASSAFYGLGMYYLQNKDFDKALSYLKKSLEQGYSRASDTIEQIERLIKEKEHYDSSGDTKSLRAMGLSYYGFGCYEDSLLCLRKVKHEDKVAALYIGEIYRLELSDNVDYTEASECYKMVMEASDTELGVCADYGRTVARDFLSKIEKHRNK